jgi:hypothetical protein
MKYILVALLAIGSCGTDQATPTAHVEAPVNPGASCSGAWEFLRMDARIVPATWYAGMEVATVQGAQFCPENPDVLFVDLTYTGAPTGHAFAIVADSLDVNYAADPVRITCRIVDMPLGELDTVITSREREGTQHNLRWIRIEGTNRVVLDLGTMAVEYAY